jgi:protease IV
MEQNPPVPTDTYKASHNLKQFLFASMVVLPALFFWSLLALIGLGLYGIFASDTVGEQCSVANIALTGVVTTTSGSYADVLDFGFVTDADRVVQEIAHAEADDSIRAILLNVNSPGGTPVAGDEIGQALAKAQKPTVAVVRDLGTSAAYWAMAGVDHIIASPVSDVGSIGVTMSYTELAGANEEQGSRWVGISSGDFKDAGNPDRPLTDEEKEYFQKQVDAVHEYMVDRIAVLRPKLTREQYADLADGKAYLGSEALGLGLVDALGDVSDALSYIAQTLGLSEEGVELCPVDTGVFGTLF